MTMVSRKPKMVLSSSGPWRQTLDGSYFGRLLHVFFGVKQPPLLRTALVLEYDAVKALPQGDNVESLNEFQICTPGFQSCIELVLLKHGSHAPVLQFSEAPYKTAGPMLE